MVHSSRSMLLLATIFATQVSSFSLLPIRSGPQRSTSCISASTEIHPAVAGWPEKYTGTGKGGVGPRVIHKTFTVQPATGFYSKEKLDIDNWPTWTTADKEKWSVGNQVKDKIMPYGELSYMISGQLEIIPTGQEDQGPIVVKPGDLVTFPEGFQASWRVLEELTWHYYLY